MFRPITSRVGWARPTARMCKETEKDGGEENPPLPPFLKGGIE